MNHTAIKISELNNTNMSQAGPNLNTSGLLENINISSITEPILNTVWEKMAPILEILAIILVAIIILYLIKFFLSWIKSRRIKNTYKNSKKILKRLDIIETRLTSIEKSLHKKGKKKKSKKDEEEKEDKEEEKESFLTKIKNFFNKGERSKDKKETKNKTKKEKD